MEAIKSDPRILKANSEFDITACYEVTEYTAAKSHVAAEFRDRMMLEEPRKRLIIRVDVPLQAELRVWLEYLCKVFHDDSGVGHEIRSYLGRTFLHLKGQPQIKSDNRGLHFELSYSFENEREKEKAFVLFERDYDSLCEFAYLFNKYLDPNLSAGIEEVLNNEIFGLYHFIKEVKDLVENPLKFKTPVIQRNFNHFARYNNEITLEISERDQLVKINLHPHDSTRRPQIFFLRFDS